MGVKFNPFTSKLDIVDSPSGDFTNIELALGTQTAPSLSFTGDPNTGIYSPGADQVAISTNGTGKVFIDSNGNVAIGGSTVQKSLTLNYLNASIGLSAASAGTYSSQGLFFYVDATAYSQIYNEGVGNLVFRNGSGLNERMRLDSSGRLGLGTSGPQALLDVRQSSAGAIAYYSYIGSSGGGAAIQVANGFSSTTPIYSFWFDGTSGLGNPSAQNISFITNSTERARIDSSGRLLVGTSTSTNAAASCRVITNANSTELRLNNEDANPNIEIVRQQALAGGGGIGTIYFKAYDSGTTERVGASLAASTDGNWASGDCPTRLVFSTTADGAASPTERMRITNDGLVRIGTTVAPFGSTGLQFNQAGEIQASRDGNYPLLINRQTSDGTIVEIRRGWQTVGTISVTTSATAYNTSSDYRLKENVVPLTGAIDRLNDLQVHRFNFIADPETTVDGFIAHEAQAVVPECVTGTKDEVDDEGNPVYQGIDQSKLVPLLTAALQEALAEIESLKARVTALEP